MTRDDIIRVAQDAGLPLTWISEYGVRLATLVAAAEREACARVCDEEQRYWKRNEGRRDGAESCAKAIRARGEQEQTR